MAEGDSLDESLHEPGVEEQALDAAHAHVVIGVAAAARELEGGRENIEKFWNHHNDKQCIALAVCNTTTITHALE